MRSGLISKRKPINSDNRKHAFYEISSNAIRFYFAYLLHSIAKAWLSRQPWTGKRKDILKIGSYWYDDRKARRNGESDVAVETAEGYEIYECKFLSAKAPLSLVREEKRKVQAIEEPWIKAFGMISSSGSEEITDEAIFILAEELYL